MNNKDNLIDYNFNNNILIHENKKRKNSFFTIASLVIFIISILFIPGIILYTQNIIKGKSNAESQGYGWFLLFGIMISVGIAIYYLFAFIINRCVDKENYEKNKKSSILAILIRIILTFYPFIRFLIFYIKDLISR